MEQPLTLFEETSSQLQRMYTIFDEVPFAIAVLKGPSLIIEYINQYNLRLWQVEKKGVIGKPLFTARPDIEDTAKPIHDLVQTTGKRFQANEVPIKIVIENELQLKYFNVIIDPMVNDLGDVIGQLATSIDVTEQVEARQKVQENGEQLRLLTDALPVLISYVDRHHRYQFINKKYEQWFQHSAEEIIDKPMIDVIGEKAFNAVKPYIEQALSGEAVSYATDILYKDGTERHILANYVPHFDKDNNVQGFYAMVTDLTDRKKAEAETLYRKALLEAQNEAIPDAVLIVDTKGKILSYNKHFAELWRIPQDVVDRKDDHAALQIAMTQVDDAERFIEKVNYYYSHTDEADHEELALKDGRMIERFGNAVTGEDGTYYGWVWYFRDITESKQKERALQASEDRYQNFIRQSTEAIWRFELDQPISAQFSAEEQIDLFFQHAFLAECNDAMAQMYGYEKATELIGARLSDFFPRNEETRAYLLHFIESKYRIESVESKEQDRYGNTKYFLNNLVGIIENDVLVRAWGTQRDITHQKEAEEKLKESENRYRNLANQLEILVTDRTKELQRSNEDLQQFAHVASHDLKEPVRKVRTFSGRLREELGNDISEKAKTYLAKIESATDRMYNMIDGVLQYSSINAIEHTNEPVDLCQLVKQIEEDLELAIIQKNATIFCSRLPKALGTPLLLYQLFYNLINNSLKFAQKDIPAIITVEEQSINLTELEALPPEKKYIKIAVVDNGIGFNNKDAERIFGSFSRLHTKDQYEGTGLGLALCKKIVARHGGTIWAEAREDEGASFVMLLPAAGG